MRTAAVSGVRDKAGLGLAPVNSPPPRAPGAPPPVAAAAPAGIVFRGEIYGGSGFADGNQDILAGLEPGAMPLQLLPLGLQEDRGGLLPPQRRRELERLQRRRLDWSQSVLYQSCPPDQLLTDAGARVCIGRTTFETDSLPPGWSDCCNNMDEVWVPSTFNRESFERAGVQPRKLLVIGEGLDTTRYRPGLKPLPLPGLRGFNFVSVFEWGHRKGWEVLLRAYCSAFRADEDVTLILKSRKLGDATGEKLEQELVYNLERVMGFRMQHVPPILLLRGMLPAQDMPRLYATADAFVLPTRGEGWGRPFMEAAASQLPVLATRWSGHLDFLNDRNSYLIDVEKLVDAPPDVDVEIFLGQRWAQPSPEHLAQLMRRVFDHRGEARARAWQARQDMVTQWDRAVVAPRWVQAFRRLLG
ncbi:MAG: glycosyltransferase [Terriglobales bacterium]